MSSDGPAATSELQEGGGLIGRWKVAVLFTKAIEAAVRHYKRVYQCM